MVLTLGEIQMHMNSLNEWSLEGNKITKNFSFSSFKEATEFVTKIGEIAEKMNHEPDVLIIQKEVRVSLATHGVNALTKIDFDFAREIDKVDLVGEEEGAPPIRPTEEKGKGVDKLEEQ